jgi:hypothetical protein
MTNMPKSGKNKSSPKKPSSKKSSTKKQDSDYFREAAGAIDKLDSSDANLAKKRWKALKDSAETDASGKEPPEVYDAGQITTGINHGIKTLIDSHIVLSTKQAFDYGQGRSEIQKELPPTYQAFSRSMKERFQQIFERLPYNFGTAKKPRYAITYAELLHLTKVPGINLVEELDQNLVARLEAL